MTSADADAPPERDNVGVKQLRLMRTPRGRKSAQDRLNVLWVTNVAAPYRVPVWEHVAQYVNLRVGLLENDTRLLEDRSMNRGDDWTVRGGGTVAYRQYMTWRLARGEHHYYFLRDVDALKDIMWADVVLLGGWESPAYLAIRAAAGLLLRSTVGFYESTLASQAHASGAIAMARQVFFRSLDRIVVPGTAAQEAVLSFGVRPDAIDTGFNAIDTARFVNTPTIEHSGHAFGFVGQLIPRKNVDGIIRAFAHVREPDDTLTLIGNGPDRDELLALCDELHLTGHVRVIAHVPNAELPNLLGSIDTLVLASHVEVWGLVANEALAAGLQVVVTQNCGVAPSIAGMPGVYEVGGTEELSDGMRRARDNFRGRIAEPPIRQYTPQSFGDVFLRAFRASFTTRK